MSLFARLASVLLAGSVVVAPAGAVGQTQESAASELFRQGREAILRNDCAAALPRLAESERLEPKVGTLINLALCEEQTGKLASALHRWADARALAHSLSDGREPYAEQHHEALALRVPRLIVRLGSGSPTDTRVTLDGVELAPRDVGAALPVEVGAHKIVARAANRADGRFEVGTSEGQASEITVEAGPAVTASPAAAPAAGAQQAARASASRLPGPEVPGIMQRWMAYGLGGLGMVALGFGTVWGIQAIDAKGEPGCHGSVCATQAQAQVQRDGRTAADRSTVAIAAASALVAGAITVWLTAPGPGISTGITVNGGAATLQIAAGW